MAYLRASHGPIRSCYRGVDHDQAGECVASPSYSDGVWDVCGAPVGAESALVCFLLLDLLYPLVMWPKRPGDRAGVAVVVISHCPGRST